jgi:hypothetical protein
MRNLWQRLLFLGALFACLPALAQTTTARLEGAVRDASGPLPGVTVTAVNTESGLQRSTVTGTDGLFNLTLPPGPYTVTAGGTTAFEEQKTTLRLQVGQVIESNFDLRPGKMATAAVGVTADAAPEAELRSSEIATNVTTEQIQSLPQATRNFMNFAALAPGVRLNNDPQKQDFSYGPQGSRNINVFIDGASYKADMLEGGTTGQDSSKGNPFPQNAIQEFRVITQNYKAEYQKASSAVISAVTKSGGNDFHGDVFAYYQNKSLVSQDFFSAQRGTPKPEYTRWQPGLSIGGPIARDKVHFFFSYEGNYQDRQNEVFFGGDPWPDALKDQLRPYLGLYPSNFRETLLFGKLSAVLGEGAALDVSGNLRHETDIRGFGSQTSFQSAEDAKNDAGTAVARHTLLKGNFLNEATVSYQRSKWNPSPANPDLVSQHYFGLLDIGGSISPQNFTQDRYAIRDDLTLLSLQGFGNHVVKGGVTFDYLKYDVVKQLHGNPEYDFYIGYGSAFPFKATYGFGDPNVSTVNRQFGVYLQDDWRVNSRLTANIGLRWDFETDMLNNNYVTPQAIRDAFGSMYSSNFFTDGTNRSTYYGAIQPRIGLSFDVTGDSKTVAFGAFGRYYDRTTYNDILDEKYRLQYKELTFFFTEDGHGIEGRPTSIIWKPEYFTAAGLQSLIASGNAPNPQVFLLDNNTKPPSSDQWNVGVRHDFGGLVASVSYVGVKSRNQLTWTCGTQRPDGTCISGGLTPGYDTQLLSAGKEGRYNALQLSADKPFSASSGWGASLSYVYGKAEQTGNDLFSLDYANPAAYGWHRTLNDQTHTILVTGIAALPLGFRLSTLISLGSGFPFAVFDDSQRPNPDRTLFKPGGGDSPKWSESVDLRLEKRFTFAGSYNFGVLAEVINLFNYVNYDPGHINGDIPQTGTNPNFGKADTAINPRRVQFGVNFGF